MSSWVENQLQEAFALYKRYIGVRLHFGEGSGYDYTLYNGYSKATMRAFLGKPKIDRVTFIQLANRLKGIQPEEFLFSQARYNNLNINTLLDKKSFAIYEDWKGKFGDPENFLMNAAGELKRFSLMKLSKGDTPLVETVASLLGSGDECYIEPISWILQSNPDIVTDVRAAAEQNIIHKMMLERIIKIQRFYSYLCII